MKHSIFIIFGIFIMIAFVQTGCKPEEEAEPPVINLIIEDDCTNDGDTVEIGHALRFKISASGTDANITNFLIEKHYGDTKKTVVDSGLNSAGFTVNQVFYQGVEDEVDWTFTVMDRNRKSASVSLKVYKDPTSQYGGIIEFENISIGFQDNENVGHFFLPDLNQVYFEDSASLYQELVDVLCYFNYREDYSQNLPSPTFSSPGEELNASGEMYDEYYPIIKTWETRNYTKYDIRAENGVTDELFNSAHNDSLLIVSYDNVWGKKKYKWAYEGTYIPFQTASGRIGIIHVNHTDTVPDGQMNFSMKIQISNN
jgi:hypothetical protein